MKTLLEVHKANSCPFDESCFCDCDGNRWSAPYLYRIAKERKLRIESITLRHLDLSRFPWSNGSITSIDDYLYHAVRIRNTDISISVIIGWDGYIMDGWHRLVKAVLENKKTIKAYRFEKYVEPETKSK